MTEIFPLSIFPNFNKFAQKNGISLEEQKIIENFFKWTATCKATENDDFKFTGKFPSKEEMIEEFDKRLPARKGMLLEIMKEFHKDNMLPALCKIILEQ
jgi:hypothetical protein